MKPSKSRTGFTLVEVLLVIGIIGVLAALIVPAIQKVRESANRTVCINNLKQIGLALQNYQAVHGVFPPGLDGLNGPQPFLSWNARILPYLEQQSLW
jgi:prepilin-type N-terminal cleavage/methylation domain-containing protein/prepilin-type processing-associated H-X9-DG protein